MIDRKKSVFKLAQGKFVAPQRLEQLYETLALVEQAWVTAVPWAEFPVAVIVVSRAAAMSLAGYGASAAGLDRDDSDGGGASAMNLDRDEIDGDSPSSCPPVGWDFAEACAAGGHLERCVLSAMGAVADADGVPSFQKPRGVILESTPWTTESGESTGTFFSCTHAHVICLIFICTRMYANAHTQTHTNTHTHTHTH